MGKGKGLYEEILDSVWMGSNLEPWKYAPIPTNAEIASLNREHSILVPVHESGQFTFWQTR